MWSISVLLRDSSNDDHEHNCVKEFNANSREGELSMPRCTQKYLLTQQAMVSIS